MSDINRKETEDKIEELEASEFVCIEPNGTGGSPRPFHAAGIFTPTPTKMPLENVIGDPTLTSASEPKLTLKRPMHYRNKCDDGSKPNPTSLEQLKDAFKVVSRASRRNLHYWLAAILMPAFILLAIRTLTPYTTDPKHISLFQPDMIEEQQDAKLFFLPIKDASGQPKFVLHDEVFIGKVFGAVLLKVQLTLHKEDAETLLACGLNPEPEFKIYNKKRVLNCYCQWNSLDQDANGNPEVFPASKKILFRSCLCGTSRLAPKWTPGAHLCKFKVENLNRKTGTDLLVPDAPRQKYPLMVYDFAREKGGKFVRAVKFVAEAVYKATVHTAAQFKITIISFAEYTEPKAMTFYARLREATKRGTKGAGSGFSFLWNFSKDAAESYGSPIGSLLKKICCRGRQNFWKPVESRFKSFFKKTAS